MYVQANETRTRLASRAESLGVDLVDQVFMTPRTFVHTQRIFLSPEEVLYNCWFDYAQLSLAFKPHFNNFNIFLR